MSVPLARLAAGSAVVAVAARLVSILTWPPDSDASHARMLAAAAAHPGAWATATLAEVVCWVAAGLAVLATLAVVTRRRGRRLRLVGGVVYGASLVTLGLVGGAMNSVTQVLARQPDRSAMVTVQGDLHTPALNTLVTLVLLGELFTIMFAIGLARAKATGWWFVAASVLALVGYVATASSSDHLVVLAGFVPLGVTWLELARLLWAHAPAARRAPLPDPVPAGADRGGALRSA